MVPSQRTQLLEDSAAYDGFPVCAAADDGTAVVLWPHSTTHEGGDSTYVAGVWSPDAGASWSGWSKMYDDTAPGRNANPCGLVWMPARGSYPAQFVALVMTEVSTATPPGRLNFLIRSDDGVTWAKGQAVSWPSARWAFPSELLWQDDGTDAGILWAAAYVSYDAAKPTVATVLRSLDRGATWTDAGSPGGRTTSVASLEPRLTVRPDGSLYCTIRQDQPAWKIISSTRAAGAASTWSTPQLVLPGASGSPAVHYTSNGEMMMLYREYTRRTVDSYHAPFGWARSVDNGATWKRGPDFTHTGRAMMYAAMTDLPGGSVLVAYGLEDPGRTWARASVFATTFSLLEPAPGLDVALDLTGVPTAVLTADATSLPYPVYRVTDTGREQINDGTALTVFPVELRDAEAPIGVPFWYEIQDATTDVLEVPADSGTWLVHPGDADLSTRVTVAAHEEWSADLEQDVTLIPGRATPFVTTTGPRQSPAGTFELKVSDAPSNAALQRILADGVPLLVKSADEDMCGWISVGSVRWRRRTKRLRDPSRRVTLPYVTTERPIDVDAPTVIRIDDLDLPFDLLTGLIADGLLP
ncbi:sialidase family protein [Luteipulveratus sp. YIM 133132]|uniref:exo-alpha-sialidase n=1 Tax=Luteipulveratus flavus TaxID=3031728 RepID=UPI0023AFA963|nr:sialidase family protein [Luteipulveratus sp. YIM 133132]MDE9365961.1 sialidase family protein [Luteipulveratus sp. YIM 133132]